MIQLRRHQQFIFFNTRDEAVTKCIKELTYESDWEPFASAMIAAITKYFAKDPENHYPLSNISKGDGKMFMIREVAENTKEVRRSLYSAILESLWSVNTSDLKKVF